jgi:hypothetical protein
VVVDVFTEGQADVGRVPSESLEKRCGALCHVAAERAPSALRLHDDRRSFPAEMGLSVDAVVETVGFGGGDLFVVDS